MGYAVNNLMCSGGGGGGGGGGVIEKRPLFYCFPVKISFLLANRLTYDHLIQIKK